MIQATRSPCHTPAFTLPCARTWTATSVPIGTDAPVERDPLDVDAVTQQVGRLAHGDRRCTRVHIHHVPTFTHRDRQSPPLAHREAAHAIVTTEHRAVHVDDRTRGGGHASIEERGATAACDETHVHALGLGRGTQPEPRRVRAHVGLGHLTDGQHRHRQRVGAEHREHVGLILRRVRTAAEFRVAGVVAGDPRVMAGGDRVEAHGARPIEQATPLHRPVALDAGVRRSSGRVVGHVRVHDRRGELVGEVEHVVRDIELRRDPAGILHVRDRAATGIAVAAPELEGDAGDLVAGIAHERGRDRRVDASAHRHQHAAHAGTAARSRATAAGIKVTARSTSASVDA